VNQNFLLLTSMTMSNFLVHHPSFAFQRDVLKSRNKELVKLFEDGVGIHHAGMLRADRGLTERLFSDGLLKVCYFPFNLF